MDELDVVRGFRAGVTAPGGLERARALARLEMVIGPAPPPRPRMPRRRFALVVATAVALAVAAFFPTDSLQNRAVAADDVFQQAVNYVFTGRTDPNDGVEIVDRKHPVGKPEDGSHHRTLGDRGAAQADLAAAGRNLIASTLYSVGASARFNC